MNIKHALFWIAVIIIITSAVFYFGWEEVISAVGEAGPLLMGVLFLMQLLTLALIAFRWYYLLNKNSLNISFGRVFAINMAGNYIESITPSVKLGGEAAKVYLLRRHTRNSYTSLAGMMLTIKYYSLMPFLVLSGMLLGLAAFQYELPGISFMAFLFLVVFFIVVAWIHHRGGVSDHDNETSPVSGKGRAKDSFVRKKSGAIAGFVRKASAHSRSIARAEDKVVLLIVSAIVWVMYPAKVYLVASMLGLDIGPVTVAVITFTSYLIGLLPLLPGGLGIFEGSMVFMFMLMGFALEEGLAVTLISRLVTYWFPLLLSAALASYLTIQPKSKKQQVSPFFSISQKVESLACAWEPAFRLYGRIFYHNKLKQEIAMSKLKPGSSVLHIGCGPCPYTAIFLAEYGMQVKALDNNAKAVQKARQMVNKRGLEDRVRIIFADGASTDCSQYDAIWISLNVYPKEKVIGQAFSSLKDGGVLIYRNVPQWLSFRYSSVSLENQAYGYDTKKHIFRLGAESVMVKEEQLRKAESPNQYLSIKSMSGPGQNLREVAIPELAKAVSCSCRLRKGGI